MIIDRAVRERKLSPLEVLMSRSLTDEIVDAFHSFLAGTHSLGEARLNELLNKDPVLQSSPVSHIVYFFYLSLVAPNREVTLDLANAIINFLALQRRGVTLPYAELFKRLLPLIRDVPSIANAFHRQCHESNLAFGGTTWIKFTLKPDDVEAAKKGLEEANKNFEGLIAIENIDALFAHPHKSRLVIHRTSLKHPFVAALNYSAHDDFVLATWWTSAPRDPFATGEMAEDEEEPRNWG